MITRKKYEVDTSETFCNKQEYTASLNIILAHLCADFQGCEIQGFLCPC